MKYNAWMKTAAGQVSAERASVREERHGGVWAVYATGLSTEPLDPDFGMGIEIGVETGIKGFMADYRYSEYWCRPAFGARLSQVPDETQALVYEKTDGGFGVILPVVSEQYKCVLTGGENGLTARLFSWYGRLLTCRGLAFVRGEGEDPFALMEACVRTALRLLNNGCRARWERRYPEIFEYLGWCSWDSMQIRVNEEGVAAKCAEFKEKKIPVRWAILDDMWAEVHDFYGQEYGNFEEMAGLMHRSALFSFRADPVRFPHGLKACIAAANRCGIRVGMWHPTTGYWRGLEKDGPAYEQTRDSLIETADGRYIHGYRTEQAYMFYRTFHDYLRSCGAEFIKIDNQTMTRRYYKGLAPVGEVARQFHAGMEASVGEHFDNQMINCMGMGSEDMWNRAVSPISRCSNDFLPENRAWFISHILQCAYNSFVQGQLYYCDWDMWWTDDGQAVKNSVLRAVSGGPVYVSDKLGRSRAEILAPLALEDGRLLRCDRPGMPARGCLAEDPETSGRVFKLQNTCGGAGVAAVFNLSRENRRADGTVSPADVWGLEGERFAVYEHFTGQFAILEGREQLPVSLADQDDFRLYVMVPYVDGFAALGDTSKYISPKTIKAIAGDRIEMCDSGAVCTVVRDGVLQRVSGI